MADTDFPDNLQVPPRDDSRAHFLRSHQLRNPAALVTEGTFPWIDASCDADQLQPIYRDIVLVSGAILLKNATGSYVDQRLADLGLQRLPAIGASGYVTVSTSFGGTTLFQGDEIKDDQTGLRYQVNNGAPAGIHYSDGEEVPITGKDVGPQTDLPGGRVIKWTSPRPGCLSTAVIVTQADGVSGLTGGKPIEDDESAKNRATQLRANPPASGNDAEYQATIMKTPGVAVQQAFTYPTALSNGSMAFVFTVRPASPGLTRIPSGAQVSAVLAYLSSQMPADDNIFAGTITAQPTNVALRVAWAQGAATWVDTAPWPAYSPITTQAVLVTAVTDALNFTLATANASYAGVAQPSAGQTIALYDRTGQLFRRKRILSVTGTGPWVIACDTSNAASDASYAPIVGQRACPWADSLNTIPPAVIAHFDSLGPGEQFLTFFDPGLRQKRSPAASSIFPAQLTNRLTTPVLALPSIQDAIIAEPAIPIAPPNGTPGVLSYLLTLGFLAVFPE